ncbi:MAG: hypothetical protein OEW68_13895 [Gammaproteobacteria bacterium]|nr:hypothetical protein [Gammaproteobacteria bacterium]MDH4315926.1 hypothetical protein [Gammaproteobacteria bacterium]MDH5215249.1 hypothetical protein [Gammaproteobacteria bacterium]
MKMTGIVGFLALSLVAACTSDIETPEPDMNQLARDYLFLELSMGLHDESHVDAYFGPEDIRSKAEETQLSLQDIDLRAAELARSLANAKDDPDRIEGLLQRLQALRTRIRLNQGEKLPFDEESMLLFGASAPDHDAQHFESILAEIDALLPGDNSLPERVEAFRSNFEIPPDRLAAVFDASIAECRKRTLQHIRLPENETFTLEYVNDKPWSGYNWYQGDSTSLIQINTDLPTYISRAVDLGCHEGYPGHHTFNALLEKNLVVGKGWLEYSLYPLFSGESLIAEGSGNYGIDLAFPGDERVDFEKSVLFPLAGLDPAQADRYYELLALLDRLNYAGNEAARDYLNGTISEEQAVQWLIDYALSSPERAKQRIRFFDTYRSYVINYNLGKDMVRDYVERDTTDRAGRWHRFEKMLSSPMLPADLK